MLKMTGNTYIVENVENFVKICDQSKIQTHFIYIYVYIYTHHIHIHIIYIYIYTYIVYMKLLIGTPKLNPKHVARFLRVCV